MIREEDDLNSEGNERRERSKKVDQFLEIISIYQIILYSRKQAMK